MHYSRRILNKIRVTVLKVITTVMTLILVACMSTDDCDMRVWIPLFVISLAWVALMVYANFYYTCGDCRDKNRCMERSRDYPCRSFKKKENKDGIHNKGDRRSKGSEGPDQRRTDEAG